MNRYLRWLLIGHYLTVIIIVIIGYYIGFSIIAITLGFLLLELIFYFLDKKYIPKRKTKIGNKLVEIFKAEPVSEEVIKFKIETTDIYTQIEVDFQRGFQIADVETIKFHIPRNQIGKLSIKPKIELKEDKINGIQTK